MKQDLFGFDNQGINYDMYRPEYNDDIIKAIMNNVKQHNNYLDLAAGTGQVYFKIQQQFNGVRIASDISQKQYLILSDKIDKLDDINCHHILSDAKLIGQQLIQRNLPTKFDLITIGQALHWLDVDDILPYIRDNLLADNGTLAILSYSTEEIYLDVDQLKLPHELRTTVSVYQDTYYNEVKGIPHIYVGYFDCDRDNLSSGYDKYDFKKYFTHIQRLDYDVNVPQTLDQVIKYMQTYSAYNVYLSKNPDKVDPIIPFRDMILEKFRQLKLNLETPPLILYCKFFTHILRK